MSDSKLTVHSKGSGEGKMPDKLLQLKIQSVDAGILARTKEDESWEYYRLHIDNDPRKLEIKSLEEKIKSLQKEIHVNYEKVEKHRHKMIDPYFKKWWKLSTKLEKEYEIKFSGKLENLLEVRKELEKQKKSNNTLQTEGEV